MLNLVSNMLQPEGLVTTFAALAAFATVLTILMPMFEGNKLAERTKFVTSEREQLRAAQKASLDANAAGRLRDRQAAGIYTTLVKRLNLRSVFEAEDARDSLRMAGYRSERHLAVFLSMRVIVPFIMAVLVYVIGQNNFPDIPYNLRIVACLGGFVFGTFAPGIFISNIIKKRQASIKAAWSDALDLMLICIDSGMSLEPSMTRVGQEIGTQSVPLAEELQLTVAELSYLPERKKALDNLYKRTGMDSVKSVVTALNQAERYGTPLGNALRVLAEENRRERMSDIEKKAASLAPKLTVPMIVFFLPVTFAVLLGPAIVQIANTKMS